MSPLLLIRISDNVLSEEDWPVAMISFDKSGIVDAICVTHKGVYSLPDCIGWSFEKLAEWQSYDPTGEHPENYYEVRAYSNEIEWFSSCLDKDQVKQLANYSIRSCYNAAQRQR